MSAWKDISTIENTANTDDSGAPLGSADVPLEALKQQAVQALQAGEKRAQDLSHKLEMVGREIQSRGLQIERDRTPEREQTQEQDMGMERDMGR